MTEVSDTLKYLKPGGPREFSVMMEMFFAYCELRMPPTVSVNKGCWSIKPSQEAPHSRELRRQTEKVHDSAFSCSSLILPRRCPWGDWSERAQGAGPDSWGAYQRNDFSELTLLHVPKHRKVLNSLTWDTYSSINSNHLMFWLPGFGGINIYISWLLPCLFRTIAQELFEMLYPGLKSSDLFTE